MIKNTNDKLVTALLEKASIRVIAISSKNLTEYARKIHNLSPTATVALGRALSAVAMQGAMLKAKSDKVSMIIDGGGPLGRIICTSDNDANVKGYATNPEADAPPNEMNEFDVGAIIGRDGFLRIIRDMGLKEPYTGMIELQSGEIANDLAHYYLQSEQQPSLVALGVNLDTDGSVKTAGGIMIMPMPGCSDESISKLEQRVMFTMDLSRQLEEFELDDFLVALFRDMDYNKASEFAPQYVCDCSRERIEKTLIALGREELNDIYKKDKKANVTCHFCNTEYTFSENELKKMLDDIG
jgi:molecular chaperone Hsp33